MELPLYQSAAIHGAGSPYPVLDAVISVLYVLYIVSICILLVFSAHVYLMVLLRRRMDRRPAPAAPAAPADWPAVTVQIPVYNEGPLAVQALEAAARLDYPADRLQVLILDGSTDGTPALVAPVAERLRRAGRNVVHYRRDNSRGYKAGGLAEACQMTEGQFIAIFDADFVPAPDFLKRVLHHFRDPRVGCVQTRWGHRNGEASLLTMGQSIILDAFYGTELPVRSAFNFVSVFTGTCGVWRKCCIEDAGGWQWDTLLEDLDLSYRSQLCGWRIVYDQDVLTPGELPESIGGFMRQQHRWTMGHTQVCRKHFRNLLRAPWPFRKKAEAAIHLLRWMTYPAALGLAVLMMPALTLNPHLKQMSILESAVGLVLFLLASGAASVFYVSGQVSLYPRIWWRRIVYVPLLISLTLALAPNCCRAIWMGLTGRKEPFRKTPRTQDGPQRLAGVERYVTVVNGVIGLYLLVAAVVTVVMAFRIEAWSFLVTAFALAAFSAGLLYAVYGSIRDASAAGGLPAQPAPAPA